MVPFLPRVQPEAYPDPAITRRSTAAARGWAKGWPDDCPGSAQLARVEVVRPMDGRTFRVTVDKRLADLVGLWLSAVQEFGHPLIGAKEIALSPQGKEVKQGGVSSYNCRAIRGTSSPSNHSSGTALDLWSRSNPMDWSDDHSPVPFKSTIHPSAVDLANAAMIYWGGHYWWSGHWYVDAMHFEFMGTPGDVADATASLEARIRQLAGQTPEGAPTVDEQAVRELQTSLNAAIGAGLVVDGQYGPVTAQAVADLPAKVQLLTQDAIGDAATAESKVTEAKRLAARITAL